MALIRWRPRALGVILAFSALAFTAVTAATAGAQLTPIRHVVIIDLENHSFDNVLGLWCAQNTARCQSASGAYVGMPAHVTLSNGAVVLPYGSPGQPVMPDVVPTVSHTVASQLAAMNIVRGVPQMNGWQNEHHTSCAATTSPPYQCVGGYRPGQVPNITALASQFAMSDTTFSMADSPSWGGHLYLAMASLDGFTGDNPCLPHGSCSSTVGGWGCDSGRLAAWLAPSGKRMPVPSCVPDYALGLPNGGAFEPTPVPYHKTIFDELDQAGLPWKIYGAAQRSDNGYKWAICPSFAECLNTRQKSNLVDASRFSMDAAAGKLPAFSIVTGGGAGSLAADSCHNGLSMTACDNYIGRLVRAVQYLPCSVPPCPVNPLWSSTAIFITMDDYGGFYDSVPPGTNADRTRQGPRVPLIIVSPYAKARYTDTTPTTTAGVLAYVERNFGLGALSPNDAQAYAFTNAFDYSQVPLPPEVVRLVHRSPATGEHIDWAATREAS